jgi:Rad3-related DNA helicase
MPTTQTLLILDFIYTGITVPEGMAGSSMDQSNTPHPSREEQAPSVATTKTQVSMRKIQCKGLLCPLYMESYYGRKRDNWQCIEVRDWGLGAGCWGILDKI